jgi:hypothetical protein
LLGSTHSVALLVRARRVGFHYWCALAMTLALAGCAFVLSFDALRDLAVAVGMRPDRAWLWPVAIDVSIANSTLALLSLTPPRTTPGAVNGADDKPREQATTTAPPREARPIPMGTPGGGSTRPASSGRLFDAPTPAGAQVPAPPEPADVPTAAVLTDAATAPGGAGAHRKWTSVAHELVRSGVTSKDPAVVAAVLAEHAAGTPLTTIGRRHKVHHSTVGRILAGAVGLTG